MSLGALGAYIAMTVALFHQAWGAPLTRTVGLRGDPDQTLWFLAWPAHALANGMNPLVSDFLLYPTGVNLTWNASVTLPAVLTTPITLWAGPILSYNVLITLAVAASAWSAYHACLHFGADSSSAFIGGALYGFSPFMLPHALGHLNLVMAFVPPLVLVNFDRAIRIGHRPMRSGLVCGSLLGIQVLVWSEFVVITAIGLFAYGAAVVVIHRSELTSMLRRGRDALVGAAATFAPISAIPVLYFLFGPRRPPLPLHEHGEAVTDLLNLTVPTAAQQFAPYAAIEITQDFTSGIGEWNAYIGIPLLVVIGLTIVRYRRDAVISAMAISAVTMVVLSMDPVVHVRGEPGSLLRSFPVVSHVLPVRLMLLVYLFVAVILALSITGTAWRRVGQSWPTVVVLALVVLSVFPRVPFPATTHTVPPFFTSDLVRDIREGSVALVVPSTPAMVWQASSGMRFKVPTGRALALRPGNLTAFRRALELVERGRPPDLSQAARGDIHRELRELQVETVMLGPIQSDPSDNAARARYHIPPRRISGLTEEGALAFLTDLLGRSPAHEGGIYVWDEISRS